MSLSRNLSIIQAALVNAPTSCRYHGTDWGALGWEGPRGGDEPRCDSCKQPWRVSRALDALDEIARAEVRS